MAIYDCFPFFNELDIAEIRFKELYDVVDGFVVSESTSTHSGKEKPLYFEENKKRFAPFMDKIHHVVSNAPNRPEKLPGTDNWSDMNWTRERFQRNQIYNVLDKICKDGDIIINTDADEIFNSSNVNSLLKIRHDQNVELNMWPSWYYLNMCCSEKWKMGKALLFKTLREKFNRNLSASRNSGAETMIDNAGWHLSYMGGFERVKTKIKSFAHVEFDKPEIVNDRHVKDIVRFGTAPWDKFEDIAPRGPIPFWKYIKVEDSHLPKCVKNGDFDHLVSKAYFSKYEYDCGNLYHLLKLCREHYRHSGWVIDINCFEGRSSYYIANALPEDTVHCFGCNDQFIKNMDSLTDGNYQKHDYNVIDLLKSTSDSFKVVHINGEWTEELLDLVKDAALLCGCGPSPVGMKQSGKFWYRG